MREKYQVIVGGGLGPGPEQASASLAEKVEQAMHKDWRLQGGVTLGPPQELNGQPFVTLMQAMVKN